jgi:hypothetical protein
VNLSSTGKAKEGRERERERGTEKREERRKERRVPSRTRELWEERRMEE